MKTQRNAIPALLAGAILAAGAAGCASWTGNTARPGDGSAAVRSADSRVADVAGTKRGPAATTADAAITAKVKSAFAADDLVRARNIDVDTMRGVVALTGTVASAAEKERAMQIARRVEGVVNVRDNLRTSG